jgi:hypothetical protein
MRPSTKEYPKPGWVSFTLTTTGKIYLDAHSTTQPVKLRAFIGGQAVAAQTFIACCLLDPLANGIGGRLELASELVDTAAGPHQFNDPA